MLEFLGGREGEEKKSRCTGDARETVKRVDIQYRVEETEPHGRTEINKSRLI